MTAMIRILILLLLPLAGFGQKILFNSDMPDGGLDQYANWLNQQNGNTTNVNRFYCMNMTTDSLNVAAIRAESRVEDTLVGGKHRSELGTLSSTSLAQNTYWYGTEEQEPTWRNFTARRVSHWQLNDSASNLGVNMSLIRKNDKYYLINVYYPNGVTMQFREYECGSGPIGERIYWVLKYIPSINGDGQYELYRDGVLVTLTNGRNQNGSAIPDATTVWGPNCNARVLGGGILYAMKKIYWKWGVYWIGIDDTDPVPAVKEALYLTKGVFGGIGSTIDDFVDPVPVPVTEIRGVKFINE